MNIYVQQWAMQVRAASGAGQDGNDGTLRGRDGAAETILIVVRSKAVDTTQLLALERKMVQDCEGWWRTDQTHRLVRRKKGC